MRGETYRCGRTLMDERIAVVRACVLPVTPVQDVVGVKVKREASVFTTGRVARAEIEEVVSCHAHCIIAGSFLSAGIAPARHEVQAARVRNEDVGEHG